MQHVFHYKNMLLKFREVRIHFSCTSYELAKFCIYNHGSCIQLFLIKSQLFAESYFKF